MTHYGFVAVVVLAVFVAVALAADWLVVHGLRTFLGALT